MDDTSKRIIHFAKENRWLLTLYGLIFVFIFIGVDLYIDNEIEKSRNNIEERIKKLYGGKEGLCIRDNNTYHIVSYKYKEKPSIEGEDSSLYYQMYGYYDSYYVATNFPWNFVQYKYDDGFLGAYIINPCAVGINRHYKRPDEAFKELYNLIIENYDIKEKGSYICPKDLKTEYHYLEERLFNNYVDTLWYSHNYEKYFFTRSNYRVYSICENYNKANLNSYLYIVVLIFLESLLFGLFFIVKRNPKIIGRLHLKPLKKDIVINQKDAQITSEQYSIKISDIEYENLLHKINPTNFMNPYDSHKVKVANDLYSVLLNSRDNDTIILMIKEKARAELGL